MIVAQGPGKAGAKVRTLEELATTLRSLKSQGKRIIHCHGVFDLLHIGHIRHFEQAKSLGDVLVVTITPDQFVNKGPGRPAFVERLRAEAVAALDCVDYVAVNKWPTSVETIRLLRPDFYVKGREYEDSSRDVTGGIELERSAVISVGGDLAFTDDVTFSSSHLINDNLSLLSEEARQYLASFRGRYSSRDILRYLDKALTLNTLVVGEAIIDEYQYCEAIGKSAKDPMLAVRHLSTEQFAGGILAVGNHVANFAGQVGLLTFLGSIDTQEDFVKEKLNRKINATLLHRSASPTIVKRRIIDSYSFAKMLEVYVLNDGSLEPRDNEVLCQSLEAKLPGADLVEVVDFGHGMFSSQAIAMLCERARFLAVNTQSNAGNLGYNTISKYPRADFVSLAENEIRLEARDRRGDIKELTLQVSKRLNCPRIVVTRGRQGCVCYSKDEGFSEIPAFAGHVVDRVGAGDAFLSIASLFAVQGAPMEVVGFIGNVVGAFAVATVGNRSAVERIPLIRYVETLLK